MRAFRRSRFIINLRTVNDHFRPRAASRRKLRVAISLSGAAGDSHPDELNSIGLMLRGTSDASAGGIAPAEMNSKTGRLFAGLRRVVKKAFGPSQRRD
jgi:hypothetical protein